MVNCWNDKLEDMVIENKHNESDKLTKELNRWNLRMLLFPSYGLGKPMPILETLRYG